MIVIVNHNHDLNKFTESEESSRSGVTHQSGVMKAVSTGKPKKAGCTETEDGEA